LGFGDNVDRDGFEQMSSDYDGAKKIVCGEHFSVIMKSDDTVWVTGRNVFGQLGLGDETDRNEFEQLPLKYTKANKICAGSDFLVIEKENGRVDVSGHNAFGQLGVGDNSDRNEFEELGLICPRKIACGSLFQYMENKDGEIISTGYNFHGQLGHGDQVNRNSFEIVPGLSNVDQIVTGGSHVFIVDSSKVLKGCGDNTLGQLGVGDNSDRLSFVNIGFANLRKVLAGFQHSVLEISNGDIYSSGYGFYGQLGLGDINNRNVFTKISGYSNPDKLFSGGYHTFMLTPFAESESSTQRFETSSSSLSIDDEMFVYPLGYFQSSPTNLADSVGFFFGDDIIIPVNDVGYAVLTHISSSQVGQWELEKKNPSTGFYSFYAELKIGKEIQFSNLGVGDVVRVVFAGPAGSELFSYKLFMRLFPDESSSSSTLGDTSSASSESSTQVLTSSESSSSSTQILTSSESSSSSSNSSSSSTQLQTSSSSSSSSDSTQLLTSSSSSESSSSSSDSSSSDSSSSSSSSPIALQTVLLIALQTVQVQVRQHRF
jgi:hypothetical protein